MAGVTRGFCLGCPVPEILRSIESGEADFCKKGLLANRQIAKHTVGMIEEISKMGECALGPKISPEDQDSTWVGCRHDYVLEISGIGDALEVGNAGIVLTAKVVKREII